MKSKKSKVLSFILVMCILLTPFYSVAAQNIKMSSANAVYSPVFPDIKGHWAYDSVEKFRAKGWVKGYDDYYFRPDKLISRAEFTAMVVRILNSINPDVKSTYPDIKPDQWFYKEVCSANEKGYIKGFPDGLFKPFLEMSRQEVAVFSQRLLNVPMFEGGIGIKFSDEKSFPNWSAESIKILASHEIIHGYQDKTFRPTKLVTRAEAVKMLDIILKKLEVIEESTKEPVPAAGGTSEPTDTPTAVPTPTSTPVPTAVPTPTSTPTPIPYHGGNPVYNAPPVVNAGPDQTIDVRDKAVLNGTVSDDKKPLEKPITTWEKADGPGTVVFDDKNSLSASASFSLSGKYVLRLTAFDGEKSTSDTMEVNVSAIHKIYTLDEDFNEGRKINLSNSIKDQLQLDETTKVVNYIWVAVSSKGTVVKINTDTGKVEGEYWTSPQGEPKDPSRTTVDLNGNVWATNRAGNSVVHIGLMENGQWIDKNGNGKCDTSTGLGDIKPWTNTNGADTNGSVSTAEDECILHYTKVNSSGTRHVSVNKDNDVWVSGTGGRIFDLIDGVTGKIKRTEPSVGYGGYGGLIDKNGVIWSSNPFLWWDTSKPLTGPSGVNWKSSGHDSYGLALDKDGNVWNTSLSGNSIRKFAPDGTLIGTYNHGGYYAQGCVADKNGDVWVAHSKVYSSINTVGHIKSDGTYVGNVTVGSGPTGVAVDAKGKIWVTNFYDHTVMRIDPNAGPIGQDGKTPVGAVDFTSVNLGGELYNYSDMTGSTLTGAPKEGTWTTVFDSKAEDLEWGPIRWNGELHNDSSMIVSVCSSVYGTDYSTPQIVKNGQQMPVPKGQYLKVNVAFKRSSDGKSPVLSDLIIGSKGYNPEKKANTAPLVDAGEDSEILIDKVLGLHGNVVDDCLMDGIPLSFSWSKVSGPGDVVFDSPLSYQTKARFSEPGDYVLKLTSGDGELYGSGVIKVRVSLLPTPTPTNTPTATPTNTPSPTNTPTNT
ncbi:MAG: S-layer homology domain-containing protein, partial [Clostridia bacterium]|nr:S-layer homology domain-containing protein [Clostridia bacterium]